MAMNHHLTSTGIWAGDSSGTVTCRAVRLHALPAVVPGLTQESFPERGGQAKAVPRGYIFERGQFVRAEPYADDGLPVTDVGASAGLAEG
jgi:hypothetical protein